jgi:hypothetical protein
LRYFEKPMGRALSQCVGLKFSFNLFAYASWEEQRHLQLS